MFNQLKALIAVPALVLLLAGCVSTTPTTSTESAETAPTPELTAPSVPTATPTETAPAENVVPVAGEAGSTELVSTLLNNLPVSDAAIAGYDRKNFKHWVSNNPTGCDTRQAVLKEESLSPAQLSSSCEISGGSWWSEYDDVTTKNPSDLDIDHMVPLKEAWESGANAWDDATREAYANDLSNPYALVAVTNSSNRSKGAQDPATWLPTTDTCVYATKWVSVKYEWNLTVNTAEKNKLTEILSFCDINLSTVVYAAPVTIAQGATEAAPDVAPVVPAPEAAAPAPAPAPAAGAATDPQFGTCKEVKANGFGPYTKGTNPEYDWYRDNDKDGTTCE
jgi:hypothetical protein